MHAKSDRSKPCGAKEDSGRETRKASSSTAILVLLTAVYSFSYLDRNLFSLMMPQMSREFRLTDTEIGQLSGIAFPVVFGLVSFVAALAADRLNRVKLIAGSVLLFSAMTTACGMAQGYWSLFVARIGVGVGEGATNPPSVSLVADHFSGPARQFANSLFAMASTFGILCAFVIFGNVSASFGWRVSFISAGIFGALVSLMLILFLRDRARAAPQPFAWRDLKGFPALFRIPSFRWAVAAAVLHSACTQSSWQWLPLFLTRSLHMSQSEISWFLGLNYSLLHVAGIIGGAFIGARLRKRSVGSTQLFGCVVILLVTLAYMTACLSPVHGVALVAIAIIILLTASNYASLLSFIQDVTPSDSQAKASAIVFCLMQVGTGGGSLLIGVISDSLVPYAGAESLRYALLPTVGISGVLAAISYYCASRHGSRDALQS